MTGDELLRRYLAGALGARVLLLGGTADAGEGQAPLPSAVGDREAWVMNAEKAEQIAGDEKGADWGTALRKSS
jgi:hypothetical protein